MGESGSGCMHIVFHSHSFPILVSCSILGDLASFFFFFFFFFFPTLEINQCMN